MNSTQRTPDDTTREYEILVAGLVGPVAASSLLGFTAVTVPTATLLTGTVANTDELRAILRVLRAHGLAGADVRVEEHRQRVDTRSRAVQSARGDDVAG